jgi:RHS repeat-associated protein
MSSSTTDLYAYTGLEADNENGSDHAMARNLALAQGRWLSPDPYMGSYDLMNPQSFNRYSYVGNMPMQFVDPSGKDPCLFALAGGGETGIGVGIGIAVCGAVALGGADITKDLLGWLFGEPTFHGSLTPRPGVRGGVWNDTFGVPYQSPLTPGGLDQVLDIPGGTGGCDFGVCVGGASSFANATTAPIGWCAEHPKICTAGADTAAVLRAIPAVAASALLLSMEGDNQPKPSDAACHKIVEDAKRTCTAQYPFPGRGNQSGKWRACVRRIVEPTGCDF